MKKEKRTKLANKEGYRVFSMHFGVFCGVLTILGLAIGIYSYYKTIKPVLDFENLKIEVSLLGKEKDELSGKIITLNWENTVLQKETNILEAKSEQLTSDLAERENLLTELEDEVLYAQADAYMSPIIYRSIMNSVYISEDEVTVKDFALEELNGYSERELSKNKEKVLILLKQFIEDEITSTSNHTDLLGYHVYMIESKYKEMDINLNK